MFRGHRVLAPAAVPGPSMPELHRPSRLPTVARSTQSTDLQSKQRPGRLQLPGSATRRLRHPTGHRVPGKSVCCPHPRPPQRPGRIRRRSAAWRQVSYRKVEIDQAGRPRRVRGREELVPHCPTGRFALRRHSGRQTLDSGSARTGPQSSIPSDHRIDQRCRRIRDRVRPRPPRP